MIVNSYQCICLSGISDIFRRTKLCYLKPLIFAFSKVSDPWSARQQRQLSAISEFTTDIRHVAGKNNLVADALFRSLLFSIRTNLHELDFEVMARDQQNIEVQTYRTALSGLLVKKVPISPAQVSLLCDISTGTPRSIVSQLKRERIFDIIHGFSHPLIRASRKLIGTKFVRHGLNRDV